MRGLALLVALGLLLVFQLPFVAADSGCGDASGDPSTACDIGVGFFGGSLGGPDGADYYRVYTPPGLGLGVGFDILNEPHVHMTMFVEGGGPAWDNHVSPGCCWGPEDPNAHGFQGAALPGGGTVVFGFELREPTETVYPYSFKVYYAELNDLSVSAPIIEPVPLETDLGEGPGGHLRKVSFTVENLWGTGNDGAGIHVQAFTPSDGRWHNLYNDGFQVTPYFKQDFSFDWNTLGYVGDVEIHVNVGNPFDAGPSNNNNAMTGTFVGLGGTGMGFSILARDNGGLGIDQCRGVYGGNLGVPGVGVCVSGGTQGQSQGPGQTTNLDLHLGAYVNGTSANVNAYYNPFNGGNADLCYWDPTLGGACYHQGLP